MLNTDKARHEILRKWKHARLVRDSNSFLRYVYAEVIFASETLYP